MNTIDSVQLSTITGGTTHLQCNTGEHPAACLIRHTPGSEGGQAWHGKTFRYDHNLAAWTIEQAGKGLPPGQHVE